MLGNEQLLEIDRICDDFEKYWTPDSTHQIGKLVGECRPDCQLELLKQLIHVDLDLRTRRNHPHDIDLYRNGCPPFLENLDTIYGQYFANAANATTANDSQHILRDAQATVAYDSEWVSVVSESQSRQPLQSRYQIISRHAKGGLGEVFIARDTELNRKVALKEIRGRSAMDQEIYARFLREAEVTGNLEHPGIVPVYGMGHYADGRPFYAMRFIEGESLEDALRNFHQSSSAQQAANFTQHGLEFRQLLGRFVSVCYAIEFAHSRGVLHRDIKPSNIMLGKYGETLVVDWGLAKVLGDTSSFAPAEQGNKLDAPRDLAKTRYGSTVGTPAYMSPEQASGNLDALSAASDVYSLGATLYAVLVGESPFGNKQVKSTHELLEMVKLGTFDSPAKRNPYLSRSLVAICTTAMSLQPGNRYPSARALAADLESWLADEPIVALKDTSFEKSRRFSRKNKRLVNASLVGLVLLLLISTTAAYRINVARENVEKSAFETKQALAALQEKSTEASAALFNAAASARDSGNADRATNGFLQSWRLRDASDPMRQKYFPVIVDHISRGHRAWITFRHSSKPMRQAFSPNGKLIAVYCEDGQVQVLNTYTGQPATKPLSHPTHTLGIRHVSFNPESTQIRTACTRFLKLWDANTGTLLQTQALPNLEEATLSPALDRVAVRKDKQGVALYQISDESNSKIMLPHPGEAYKIINMMFSRDGSRFASICGEDNKTRLWNTQTGQVLAEHVNTSNLLDYIVGIQFSPNCKICAMWDAGGNTVFLFDAETGEPYKVPLRANERVQVLEFSPDGTRIAIASPEEVRLWNTETGGNIGSTIVSREGVVALKFSPDGLVLATASQDKIVRFWDGMDGTPVGMPINAGLFTALDFSPEGDRFAVSDEGGESRIWNLQLQNSQQLANVRFIFGSNRHGAIDHSAQHIAIPIKRSNAGARLTPDAVDLSGGAYHVINIKTGATVGSALQEEIDECKFDQNSDVLLTASYDGKARLWNYNTGELVHKPWNHGEQLSCAALSYSGNRVATASLSKVCLWDLEGKKLGTIKQRSVSHLACSPDGSILATAAGSAIQLWDLKTLASICELKSHEKFVNEICFNNSGELLASSSADHTTRIWNAHSGELACEPLSHDGEVYSATFSHDDQLLATCSFDRSVRLWDVATGERLAGIPQPDAPAYKVAFTEKDDQLTAILTNGTLRHWDINRFQPSQPDKFLETLSLKLGPLVTDTTSDLAGLSEHSRIQQLRYRSLNAQLAIDHSDMSALRFHLPWLLENDANNPLWKELSEKILTDDSAAETQRVATDTMAINDDLGGFVPAVETIHNEQKSLRGLDFDFESLGFRDWTAKGAAFRNQPIYGDRIQKRRRDMWSRQHGSRWVGSYEVVGDVGTGTLTSRSFVLTHPWVSYLIGGGSQTEVRLEIIESPSEAVLASNSAFDQEEMQRVEINLSKHLGKTVHIQLVDNAVDNWGHINFDDFRLHSSRPSLTSNSVVTEMISLGKTVKIDDLVSEVGQKPLKSNSFDSVTKFKELNKPYYENGAMSIKCNGGYWGWNFADLSVNQAMLAKLRVLNNKSGIVGVNLTQKSGPGLSVWIDGQAIATTSASMFANDQLKATTPKRRFRGKNVIRPVGEWNELLLLRREQDITVYINGSEVGMFDLGSESKLDAILSLGITSRAEGTTVEMDEFAIYAID